MLHDCHVTFSPVGNPVGRISYESCKWIVPVELEATGDGQYLLSETDFESIHTVKEDLQDSWAGGMTLQIDTIECIGRRGDKEPRFYCPECADEIEDSGAECSSCEAERQARSCETHEDVDDLYALGSAL